MKAVLIISHGSRVEESNDQVLSLINGLDLNNSQISLVGCGFLEMAQPNITDAGQALIDQGATELIVLPYFLAPGKHVSKDIPHQLQKLSESNTQISLQMLPYFGSHPSISSMISKVINKALEEIR